MRILALTCAFLFVLAAPAMGQVPEPFSSSPDPPVAGQPVDFTPDPLLVAGATSVEWTFGTGATPATATATVAPFTGTTTYDSPGPRTVTMTVLVDGVPTPTSPHERVVNVVAPNVAPVPQFSFSPAAPVVGQEVIFESFSYDPDGSIAATEWDLSYDGLNFDVDLTGARPTTKFATAGTRTIGLRVRDDDGATNIASQTLTIGPAPANPLPVAQFSVSPNEPVVGQQVSLRSFSYDPGGSVVAQRWDLDGDLDFDENVTGATAFTTFATPGTKTVRLEVRGSDGQTQTETQTIRVTSPPRARSTRASLLYPFPVVRLAGSVFPRGARVRTLEVRAPRRSKITVRCAGRSCPAKRIAKRQTKRTVRFKRMARFLPAGTVIKVSIRKGDRIGKHTRWRIRGGKLPKRTDRCLYPERRKPTRCPRG